MKFGALIKKARKKANLTEKQVADAVGTSRQYIVMLENEKHLPGLDMVQRLAVALDLDPVAVLKAK